MPHARKRFGQHFREPVWIAKVLEAIDPRPDEVFIEIGPGRGALTDPLAARTERVFAFEIDRDLATVLRQRAPANLTLTEGDFLELSPVDLTRILASPGSFAGRRFRV